MTVWEDNSDFEKYCYSNKNSILWIYSFSGINWGN